MERASRAAWRGIATPSEAPPGRGLRYDVGIRSLGLTQGSTPAWSQGWPVGQEGGSPDTRDVFQEPSVPVLPFQNMTLSF